MAEDFLYKEESYSIIGACFEVYNEVGCGFAEQVYQECLEREFLIQNIPFVAKPKLHLEYKGERLLKTYEADLICYDKIIVELKAVSKIVSEHQAQLLNYLAVTQMKVGLIVNFGHYPKLQYERMANTQQRGQS